MKIEWLKVENFKGLCCTSVPISNMVCIVGENNAGKSSLLQSLLLFINGTKILSSEFYNPSADILITIRLSDITAANIESIAEEHRARVQELISDGKITLARRYATDGTSKLRVVKMVPTETKYYEEPINEAFRGKKGKDVGEALKAFYPEVGDNAIFDSITTQGPAKELIQEYIKKLPADKLTETDVPLPTGIDNSFRALMPEPVYIAAVKDLGDELKAKENASFGKLLNILLNVIEDDLVDAKETFEALRKKLNRYAHDDGSIKDDRMDKVKDIEKAIQTNLNETFRNVAIELQIPPPEIKSILSNANIIADDGVRGPIDHKGDGFKRAITFSILRTYVQLSQNPEWRKHSDTHRSKKDRFLFLFEEPELYLHPRAQNILFDALALISQKHQVVVTTHSPLFFSATETNTFVKMFKTKTAAAPIGTCIPIDLTNMTERDRFQLISFESSNVAFFSNQIILVEGDSDAIILPHICPLYNENWDLKAASIDLVRVNGKGSFKRYKEFFDRFNVEVMLFADLDTIIKDFDKLLASTQAKELRDELLQLVDKIVDDENKLTAPTPKLLKEEIQKERANRIYGKICAARAAGDIAAQTASLDELFVFEKTEPRLEVLKSDKYKQVLDKKRELLTKLREEGIFVLERGAIEAYYPDGIEGSDKPTRAQRFCKVIDTKEKTAGLSSKLDGADSDTEFQAIFKKMFSKIGVS